MGDKDRTGFGIAPADRIMELEARNRQLVEQWEEKFAENRRMAIQIDKLSEELAELKRIVEAGTLVLSGTEVLTIARRMAETRAF
jgi:hypothetical protein